MRLFRLTVVFAVVFAVLGGFAQAKGKKKPGNIGNGFEPVPKRALVELKAAVGKPIETGFVFINGKYLEPPYKVERYGTAIRINGQQVTGQVVPWDEFVKTQAGAKVEKTVEGGDDAEEEEEEEPVVEEEEEEEEELLDEDEDWDDDIDDLFDEVPVAKKTQASEKKTGGRTTLATSKKAKPKRRVEVVKVTLDGAFTPNDASKALLEKVNKERTDIDLLLRGGGYVCFGRGYVRVSGDARPAGEILAKLPGIQKANTDYAKFVTDIRAQGLSYLTEPVIKDLFKNRLDHVRLTARARAEKEAREWEKITGSRN